MLDNLDKMDKFLEGTNYKNGLKKKYVICIDL